MPKCPYQECNLPENNNKYLIQFVYQCVSIFVLWKNYSEFAFFPIFMFTAPIATDLMTTKLQGKLFKAVRIGFLVFNAAFVVFSLAGLSGFFVNAGTNFSISNTSLILPNWGFSKLFLAIPLIIDLVVPIAMYYACPSMKTMETIKMGQAQRKGVKQ